jgi:DNA-binding MarR family transcriptional regulator
MLELINRFEDFVSYLPRIHKRLFSGCEVFEDLNMTSSQYHALQVLSQQSEWRMSDLSASLHVSAGSLTTMINRLTDLELVDRTRSVADRRVVTVAISDKGRKVLTEGSKHMRATMAALLATISAEDRHKLNSTLEQMNEIVEKLL